MSLITGGPIINEIHYDNAGGDTGEFIELKAPSGMFDFTGYDIVLYNGSNGASYNTVTIDAGLQGTATTVGGCTFLYVPISGIQNGAPDGVALANPAGGLCEFLSYEGVITATNGPASGMTSTDIGVAETGTTPIGESLQLINGVWTAPMPQTPSAPNICFLAGTKIKTPNGYTEIEKLNVDDIIFTASGNEIPIKWVGIQSVNINDTRNPLMSNPVTIAANAIADGIPSNDLSVSPNHAVYVEGILINAGALVNNVNIIQLEPTESFKYYHIELDSHELIVAENMWTESYLPQNENRDDFDNSEAFDEMYPEGRKILLWPLNYPRISAQVKVPQYLKESILEKVKTNKTA